MSTEKEITVNVVHKKFHFLGYACNVRKASIYQGFRAYGIKTSMFSRGGNKYNPNKLNYKLKP